MAAKLWRRYRQEAAAPHICVLGIFIDSWIYCVDMLVVQCSVAGSSEAPREPPAASPTSFVSQLITALV